MLKHIIPKAIWDYRYFIFTSVKSDFRNRVARSRLGFLWLIIAPLSQVLIYAFVLSSLMSQKLPNIDSQFSYSIYLLSGFLGWFLFLDIFNRCTTVFIENANVIKKISFPRLALPIIIVLTAIINNFLFFIIVLAVYYIMGFHVGPSIFWLPIVVGINILFASSLGVICGVLNVFIRDVGQILGIVIQFLFWMTPIVYTIDILPPTLQSIVSLNPVYWIISGYHDSIVYSQAPNALAFGSLFIISVLLSILAIFLFRKSSSEMVDVL